MRRILSRWIFGLAVLLGLVLFGLSTNAPAQAAGTVTNCTTYGPGTGTLQEAVVGGGNVQFACSGTIPVPATINVANTTSLDATGQNVTLDGQHAVQLFSVGQGISFTVKSLTLANGNAGASAGGAINVANSYLLVENSHFTGNSAATGGAIYIGGSTAPNFTSATILSTTIANNTATTDGAGVAVVTTGLNTGATAVIKASTIATNTATGTGGGLLVRGGSTNTVPSVTVANSTLSYNTARQGGGIGAETYSANNLRLVNVTLGGNSATSAGNSLFNSSTITNSLFVTNTILSSGPAGTNCSGPLADGGHNVQWANWAAGNCVGGLSDPKLGPLEDNGGPTFTQAPDFSLYPLPYSADLNACQAPPVGGYDQRGIKRGNYNRCTIGAYEIQILVVNSVADSDDGSCDLLGTGSGNKDCTLREAINTANRYADPDYFFFQIPGNGTRTIMPNSPLPAVKYSVNMFADEQYGTSYCDPSSSVPPTQTIEINGANAGPGATGLVFQGPNNYINGLTINGFQTQMSLQTPNFDGLYGSVLVCNYLGVRPDGKTVPPGQEIGLEILNSPKNTSFGHLDGSNHITGRNVISGNSRAGILIEGSAATANYLYTNFIGTDASGTQAVPNGVGILIDSASQNQIGPVSCLYSPCPTTPDTLIAGNSLAGVLIQGSGAVSNTVSNIYIGAGYNRQSLGNSGNGVRIKDAPGTTINKNLIEGNGLCGVMIEGSTAINSVVENNDIIGNTLHGLLIDNVPANSSTSILSFAPIATNNIWSNLGSGIVISGTLAKGYVIRANGIGTSYNAGPTSQGNTSYGVLIQAGASNNQIIDNEIGNNGKAGVYLADGTGNAVQRNSIYNNTGLGIDLAPTGVNPNGTSSPANLGQPYPVFSSVVSGSSATIATGILTATANQVYNLNFYSNAACDTSGYGEGQNYFGSMAVTTNASGQASFTFSQPGYFGNVTATATDAHGNTSEFSSCRPTEIAVAPSITVQSASQTVLTGQEINLSVTVTGTLPLSYQWYTGTSGQTASPIAGATASTYTTPPLFSTSTYWVRVSNAAGQADSATITLTVQSPPTCTNDLVVSQTSDNGQGDCGTLSHALSYADTVSSTTPINISFTVLTVTVSGPLPAISNINGTRVMVDGGCSAVSGRGQPGVYLTAANGAGSSGLQVGNNVTVSGLAIGGFSGYALDVQGSNNVIKCNWLGNVNGVAGSANGGGIRLGTPSAPSRGVRSGAIRATGNASNNSLGVAGDPTSGNVIGGNGGYGLLVGSGQANTAYYNWIGYNWEGTPNRNTSGAVQVARGGQLKFGVGNRIHG